MTPDERRLGTYLGRRESGEWAPAATCPHRTFRGWQITASGAHRAYRTCCDCGHRAATKQRTGWVIEDRTGGPVGYHWRRPAKVPRPQVAGAQSVPEDVLIRALQLARPDVLISHGTRTQYELLGYRIDIAVPALLLAIEVDGYAYHSREERFLRDRIRDRRLALNGWLTARFTANEVLIDAAAVVREITDLATRRASDLRGA